MSRTRFAAHFRAVVGKTPIDDLTLWRMTIARQLLAKGKPVTAVAAHSSAERAPIDERPAPGAG